MHFMLQTPSLQHLAGVEVVVHLWSRRDIFAQIAQSCNGHMCHKLRENTKNWNPIEGKVKSKVWVLPLPKPCKHRLLNLVKPLGMEILCWSLYHNLYEYRFQFFDNLLPQQVCWTMHGTIDYTKTAKLMVKVDRVDIKKRYIIACINCLEDEARELIEHIPQEPRLKFVKGEAFGKVEHEVLIALFTRTLLWNVDELNRQYHGYLCNKFKMMLHSGSRATCEHLFKKLSQEEKEQVLVDNPMKSFRRETDIESSTCNLMYYLSLMNEKQQERMFRECISGLLIFLLRWPLQSFFKKVTKRGWQFMTKTGCAELLSAIISKILNDFRDYDYYQLFWECWSLSPADYQQHFLNVYDLEGLFATKEEKFMQLILNQAPSHQLKKLADYGFYIMGQAMTGERVIISDAKLMECKQTALLNTSNDKEDVEKRLRSEHVGRIVDIEVKKRMKGL